MARLPYPPRENMPTELSRMLAGLPRNNITEMFAHATSLTAPFLRLAKAQFTTLELDARQRELIILTVAGLIDCDYEYVQHIPSAEAAGIDARLRERIRDGELHAPNDPTERALLAFVGTVVEQPTVPDDVFESIQQYLTARQIVETLQLVGFYWGLGRICTVLELELDHPAGLTSISAVSNLDG